MTGAPFRKKGEEKKVGGMSSVFRGGKARERREREHFGKCIERRGKGLFL